MTNICTKRASLCTKRVKTHVQRARFAFCVYNRIVKHEHTTNDTTRDATTHDASHAMRRRDMRVDELRVTTHAINVLRVMRDEHATIFYDDETCVILTRDVQRKISHKCVKSLRAMRFIRARDNDVNVYDARTRTKCARTSTCATNEQLTT
jgi:hypothetical protein